MINKAGYLCLGMEGLNPRRPSYKTGPSFRLVNWAKGAVTDAVFPEYIQEVFCTRDTYLAARLAGLELLTCSMPTNLSY
jgi:hypothetical protein